MEETTQTGVKVTCYYKNLDLLENARSNLLRQIPNATFTITEIADQDWNAQWKATMKPALIAPGVWASPLWLPPKGGKDDFWIKIEPKMAFGSGHHATTRLAASAIQKMSPRIPSGYALLDIGCGSGILCFIARLFGAGFTVGIDIDPDCAGNLAENLKNNPSPARGGFSVGGIDMLKAGYRFDCCVMNMIQTESQPMLDPLTPLLKPDGFLLWSGILIEEKSGIIERALTKGFSIVEETTDEEWWCGVFTHG
jgi:ribosomal protein L11 methyltransferase